MLELIAVGVVILNAKILGGTNDGKILLKTLRVWTGENGWNRAHCCRQTVQCVDFRYRPKTPP